MKVAEFKLNYNNLILQFEGETGKKLDYEQKSKKEQEKEIHIITWFFVMKKELNGEFNQKEKKIILLN